MTQITSQCVDIVASMTRAGGLLPSLITAISRERTIGAVWRGVAPCGVIWPTMTDYPDFWLCKGHPNDQTPNEPKPTFSESEVFEEWLKREFDILMSFSDYLAKRQDVININMEPEE